MSTPTRGRLRPPRRTRVARTVAVAAIMVVATSCTQVLTMYLGNAAHTNFQDNSGITTGNAATLQPRWTAAGGAGSSAQPVVWDGVAYWGDWNGNEHATALDGTERWATNLGTTQGCFPPSTGVSSTATIAAVDRRHVVIVGGGDATLYSLDAETGAVIWATRLGSSPDHFIWGSPGVDGESAYIGVASYGACPLVQGQVVKVDVHTGAIQATFDVVPDGCVGGGVSSSPAIDHDAGVLYLGTGNNDFSCQEPYATSIVALRLSDLTLIDSWQPPTGELTLDGDFLGAPTVFHATVDGQDRKLVGIPNKNGTYYAFAAGAFAAGPVWRAPIAKAGTCPCNGAAISPAAYDGATLYVAGGATTNPDGSTCGGTLQALDPSTGASRWRNCYAGAVLGAVTAAPDLLVVGSGKELRVVASADGANLFTYAPGLGNFWATTTIAGDTLLAPNMNGNLLALSPA